MNGSTLENASVDAWKVNGDDLRNSKENVLTRFPSGDPFWLRQRMLLWSTVGTRWEYSDGGQAPVWTALNVSAGSTLDSAHTAGGTITATNATGVVGITDTQTTAQAALTVTTTGVTPGTTSKTGVTITNSAVNTTSGTVGILDLVFSGSVGGGTARGLSVTMPAASDYAIDIISGSLRLQNGDLALDDLTLTGDLTITTTKTATAVTVTADSVTTSPIAAIHGAGLTTGSGLNIYVTAATMDYAGGGRALSVIELGGVTNVFDVGDDGATHIAGTAKATTAFLMDAGDAVLTSGHLVLTSGNLTQTAGNYVNTLGNGTFTAGNLTLSAGVLTVTPSAVTTKGFVLAGTGTRTVALQEITASGTFNQPQVKWTASAAGTNDFFSGSITGALTGNFWKTLVGAVAFTGDVVNIDLGATSTIGQALVIAGGAAARTTALTQYTDASTGAAADTIAMASANTSATGAMLRQTQSANFAGCGTQIVTDAAAVGAFGIKISSATRAFTSALVDVSIGAANTVAPAFLVTQTATGAATGVSHGYSFVSTGTGFLGSGFKATVGASTGASVLVGTSSGGNRTTNLVDITDAGVGAGHTASLTASGIGSGHLLYGTFSAAGTGNGLHIAMASNVAGGGLVISSAATTGAGVSVTHTGAFDSSAGVRNVALFQSSGSWDADTTNASYVLNVKQLTGAGAVGDYAAHISATGTNVEGLWVDDGKSVFDEAVKIGVSGTGPGADVGLTVYANPGQAGIAIDGTTSGNRPTHTSGVLYVPVTTATASTVSGLFTTTTSGDRDGVVGVESRIVSGGLTTATKLNHAFKALVTGTGTDTGYFAGLYASFASSAAAAKQMGLMVDGTHDYTVTTFDQTLLVQPITTSSGNGKPSRFSGGAALTSGLGGDVYLSGGDGANAGSGGTVYITSGALAGAGADGTIILGIGALAPSDKITLSEDAVAGDLGAVRTIACAGTLRPTVIKSYATMDFELLASTVTGIITGTSRRGVIFAQSALGTDIATATFSCTPYVDVSADMTVTLTWTGIAAVGGSDVRWNLAVQTVADNGDWSTSLTSIATTVDTLSAVKQQERLTFTITGGTLAAGSKSILVVRRDGAVGTDTDTSNAYLTNLDVAYKALGLS